MVAMANTATGNTTEETSKTTLGVNRKRSGSSRSTRSGSSRSSGRSSRGGASTSARSTRAGGLKRVHVSEADDPTRGPGRRSSGGKKRKGGNANNNALIIGGSITGVGVLILIIVVIANMSGGRNNGQQNRGGHSYKPAQAGNVEYGNSGGGGLGLPAKVKPDGWEKITEGMTKSEVASVCTTNYVERDGGAVWEYDGSHMSEITSRYNYAVFFSNGRVSKKQTPIQ